MTVTQTRRQHLTDASPSELLDATLRTTPKERAFDRQGRPLIIPADIIDLYGAPHRIIQALGNTMQLLLERVTPLDGAVEQQNIIRFIAEGCKKLSDEIEVKLNEFGQKYPD